ncbi:MAG: stage V sporulation protein AD [Clostridia bacterium]|nr:stage V sporulation protein AD [Clostridia bacterium]
MQSKTLRFDGDVTVISSASVVGEKEHTGPIGDVFDLFDATDKFGKKTWEKSEGEMQRLALNIALSKGKMSERDIDAIFAGDLLNQCSASAYGLLDYDVPYFGLYGACSTAAESMMLSAMAVSAGFFSRCAAVTSSHNCSSERQFRTPLEYGAQRSPTAQWTVTGSGAFIIGHGGSVRIAEALPGIVIDKGVNDASNMGAAMAPAAAHTIKRYFEQGEVALDDVDLIVTGDLGYEGSSILCELLLTEGYDIKNKHNDCGMIIFSRGAQDMHSGGSGCGCSAVVMASYILPKIARGELNNVLFIGTGAMMSPSSIQQGLSIPSVGHLLRLCPSTKNKGE